MARRCVAAGLSGAAQHRSGVQNGSRQLLCMFCSLARRQQAISRQLLCSQQNFRRQQQLSTTGGGSGSQPPGAMQAFRLRALRYVSRAPSAVCPLFKPGFLGLMAQHSTEPGPCVPA